jgi:hypothetical protein
MNYQEDNIENIYNEIEQLEAEIITAAASLKSLGEADANASAIYENKKNRYLIELFAEEAETGTKRTESIRQAMYRRMYETERLQKSLATNALKSTQEYVKAMLSVLSSRQSRMRVLESERKSAEYGK